MGRILREEQLEQLIDRYQHLIFSICYKLTSDYFAAEDLAQETFLSAYEKFATFDGKNEKAWLCRIAVNKGLDYRKSAGRRSIPTEDSYFLSREADSASPEQQTLEQEVRGRLLAVCRSLKPPYDRVAEDYYYHELDAGEIARRQGKNPKTIQTQIYRARAMLRKIYREYDPKETESAQGKGGNRYESSG